MTLDQQVAEALRETHIYGCIGLLAGCEKHCGALRDRLTAAIARYGDLREKAGYERGLRDGAHNPGLDEALNMGDGVYRP